jgi:hypothetical protein
MPSGIEIRLVCGHMILLMPPLPHVGDNVWCTRCDMPREVQITKEWYVRCNVCIYARFTGASQPLAMTKATAHFRKTGHKLRVGRYGTVDVTVGHDDVTESCLNLDAETS